MSDEDEPQAWLDHLRELDEKRAKARQEFKRISAQEHARRQRAIEEQENRMAAKIAAALACQTAQLPEPRYAEQERMARALVAQGVKVGTAARQAVDTLELSLEERDSAIDAIRKRIRRNP